jgi:hypothetical protein
MRWLVLTLVVACDGGGAPAIDAAPAGAIQLTAGAGFSGQASDLRWGANSDCPAAGSAVVSVTIRSFGGDPTNGFGICLPRPDLVGSAAIDLGDDTKVQLVGAVVSAGGCSVGKAAGAKPTGTVTFAGFSTSAGASYQMTVNGQVGGTTTCVSDGGPVAVPITFSGTALVTPR